MFRRTIIFTQYDTHRNGGVDVVVCVRMVGLLLLTGKKKQEQSMLAEAVTAMHESTPRELSRLLRKEVVRKKIGIY